MKKIIAVFIALILCVNISAPAIAVESSPAELDRASQEAVNIWLSLYDEGEITVDEKGILKVNEENSYVGKAGYDLFLEAVALYNESILAGIFEVDDQTGEIMNCTSVHVPDQIIIEGEKHIRSQLQSHVSITTANSALALAAHSCSYPDLDLIKLCEDNYNELNNVYKLYKVIDAVAAGVSAWLCTAGYWVSKVMENGEWDYKTQPGFKPWNKTFCSYYDGKYHHITSEYIGNYNYGYTGSLLFSLDVLHFGSSAVAGFDPADKGDWPAIDAGFKKATE